MMESKAALLMVPWLDKIKQDAINMNLESIKNGIIENKTLAVATAASGVALTTFAYYVYSQYRLFKKYEHIPGPGINSFLELLIGNYKEMEEVQSRKKIMSEKLVELSEKYGPIIKLHLLDKVMVNVFDPEAIKQIIIEKDFPKTDIMYYKFGLPFDHRFLGRGLVTVIDKEKWRKNRAVLNNAFHRHNLEKYIDDFNLNGNILMEKLRSLADGKTYVTMLEEFNRVALDVIAKVAFGLNINSIEDPKTILNVHFTKGLQAVTHLFYDPFYSIKPSNFSQIKEYKDSIKTLRQFAKDRIMERVKDMQSEGYVNSDIFSNMVEASRDNQIDLELLIDEFITLFAAGQETTANALTFCILELGRNPDVLQKLREEIDQVLGQRRDVTNEDLSKLEYTSSVFKESLRKWPPAAVIGRTNTEDINLGGHIIPKDSWLILSTFAACRDPKNFPEPEKFRPERFYNKENVSTYAFFPFSMGPRNCIGQNFAQIEGRTLLAKFIQNFDFELDPNQSFDVEECVTVRPVDGCRVRLTLRQ